MAWTAPATQSTGDLITATLYNNFINNISFLGALKANEVALSSYSAAGEILFNSAVKVTDASNQTISGSTWTSVDFDQEFYDTDTMHDTVTANSRLTCQTDGKYIAFGNISWDGNSSGRRGLRIQKNATPGSYVGQSVVAPPDANDFEQQVVAHVDLTTSDYLRLQVYHDITTGGSLDIVNTTAPDDFGSVFGMILVSV